MESSTWVLFLLFGCENSGQKNRAMQKFPEIETADAPERGNDIWALKASHRLLARYFSNLFKNG